MGVVIALACLIFFSYKKYKYGYWGDPVEKQNAASVPQNTQAAAGDNTAMPASPNITTNK
ncbi:MAG: hypothetical protein P4M11_11895 [Candidatus Pacebacteria bacterium]|nr:hypothetical protein [Candidatus Paceibacterota bacterium]